MGFGISKCLLCFYEFRFCFRYFSLCFFQSICFRFFQVHSFHFSRCPYFFAPFNASSASASAFCASMSFFFASSTFASAFCKAVCSIFFHVSQLPQYFYGRILHLRFTIYLLIFFTDFETKTVSIREDSKLGAVPTVRLIGKDRRETIPSEYQSGSIILQNGQNCQRIAFHDCTLSFASLT